MTRCTRMPNCCLINSPTFDPLHNPPSSGGDCNFSKSSLSCSDVRALCLPPGLFLCPSTIPSAPRALSRRAILRTQSGLKSVISATCSTFIGFSGRLNRRITLSSTAFFHISTTTVALSLTLHNPDEE